jgi:membrane protein implicated in regulation of membrane protease activity
MNTLQIIWGGLLFGMGFWFALIVIALFSSILIIAWATLKDSAEREKAEREAYESMIRDEVEADKCRASH